MPKTRIWAIALVLATIGGSRIVKSAPAARFERGAAGQRIAMTEGGHDGTGRGGQVRSLKEFLTAKKGGRGVFGQDLKPERRGAQARHPRTENVATVPYWTGAFRHQGLTYSYKMVGTDPKRGSATTVVPTELIPLRFVFDDGTVSDASADSIDGRTSIQGILDSPIFQAHDFRVGRVAVGNTQYGDAFQRANFWSSVSRRARDYHVLLGQPSVLPSFEVRVPDAQVQFFIDPDSGVLLPLIDESLLVQASTDAIQQAGISPETLPIVVWGNIAGLQGVAAYHDAEEIPGGIQTYISTGFHPRSPFYAGIEDSYGLSHEVLEWMDDPFTDNLTPGWDFAWSDYPHCQSWFVGDLMEVADTVEIFLDSDLPIDMPGVTYHVTDAAFLDYFTRAPSTSANGQYTFAGFTNAPSAACAGHVELVDTTILEYPGAQRTIARGIDNRGRIVGDFLDESNRQHGFLYDGRAFRQMDYPGAVRTLASGINDAGAIVGYYQDAGGSDHGFLYSHGRFGPLDFPASLDHTSIAWGINSRGDIAGEYDLTVPITHGFLRTGGGMYQTVDSPFGLQAEARGINDLGVVVGDAYDDPFSLFTHGFVFDGTTFSLFDFPGAIETVPWAINNRGDQGGQFYDPLFGYGGYVTIHGYPYQVYGGVYGLNDRHQVVGYTSVISCSTTGCVPRRVGFVASLPR